MPIYNCTMSICNEECEEKKVQIFYPNGDGEVTVEIDKITYSGKVEGNKITFGFNKLFSKGQTKFDYAYFKGTISNPNCKGTWKKQYVNDDTVCEGFWEKKYENDPKVYKGSWKIKNCELVVQKK